MKKVALMDTLFLRAREKCVSNVCKLQKIAAKCEKMRRVAKKDCKKAATYGVNGK